MTGSENVRAECHRRPDLRGPSAKEVSRARPVERIVFSVARAVEEHQSQAAPIIDFSVTSEGFDFRLQDVPSDPDYELFFFFFDRVICRNGSGVWRSGMRSPTYRRETHASLISTGKRTTSRMFTGWTSGER